MKGGASPLHSAILPVAAILALVLALSSQFLAPGFVVSAPPGPGGKPGPLVRSTNTPPRVIVRTSSPRAPLATDAPVMAGGDACGLILDFEQIGNWRRGDEPYGTLTQSPDLARSGSYSAQIAYNFPTPGNDYVVFLRSVPIGGSPRALTVWVYGDGSSHYLNFWVRDAGGEVWSFTFGQIKHQGWQQMVGVLDINQPWPVGHVSGPQKGRVDYPIALNAIVLDDAPDSFIGSGRIYLDDLECSESTPAPAAPVPAPLPGAPGRIAFAWLGEGGSPDLYTIQPDGGSPARLTNTTGFEGSPVWSPDGSRLLFQCCAEASCMTDLCVINADGSGRMTLLQGIFSVPGQEGRPAWSPDGQRIAYTGPNPHFPAETSVFLARFDGSAPIWLTGGRNPDWSPDNVHIAVSDLVNGVSEIMTTNVDGTDLRQVTNNGNGTSDYPAWSPDGARIAYCLHGKGLVDDGLHVINADGAGDRRIGVNCSGVDWSPDGRRLIVSQFDDLLIVDSEGGGPSVLTNGREPSWSRDQLLTVSIQQPFGPIVFSSGFDQSVERPVNPGDSFPFGTTDLYAAWPYSGVQPGERFSFDWYVNDEFWFSGEDAFRKGAGMSWQWVYQPDRSPLPAGTYRINIKFRGQQILTSQAIILSPGQSAAVIPKPPVSAGGACRVRSIEPSDRASFGPGSANVTLRWELDRPLAANEYFFVNVPFPHGGGTWYDGSWRDPAQQLPSGTRDPFWVLRTYLCMPGFSDTGWYNWYVEVRRQLGAEPGRDDPVQCRSATWSFNWSGCEPTPTPTEETAGPYD